MTLKFSELISVPRRKKFGKRCCKQPFLIKIYGTETEIYSKETDFEIAEKNSNKKPEQSKYICTFVQSQVANFS